MEAEQHVNVLGWVYFVFSILGLLVASGFTIFILAVGFEGENIISLGLFTGIMVFLIFFSLFEMIAAWYLLKRREWARIAIVVFGCLGLLSIPIGTLLGIYTLWALIFNEDVRKLFT